MLDIQAIALRLQELDETARIVLAEDRKRSDHRVFWTGMDTSSRNLERLYRLTAGAEIEQRIARLEATTSPTPATPHVRWQPEHTHVGADEEEGDTL
ncbi:MAG TPA: hypothetical protein VF808_14445 [Ktedonobacterales bacterium]